MALPFFRLIGIDDTSQDFQEFTAIPEEENTVTPTGQPASTIDTADTVNERIAVTGSETVVENGRIVNRITLNNGEVIDQDLGPEGGVPFTQPTSTPTSSPNATPGGSFSGMPALTGDPVTDSQILQRQSAFEVLKQRFTSYGLTELANEIEKIFKGEGKTKAGSAIPIPTSESGFYLALIETEAYYKRFGKVNEMRIKSGYSALDERTILGMEDEYQKIMTAYNMPKGFYDTPEDFQTFISNDLSTAELADRLQASRQFAQVIDPTIKDQLKSLYNIDENSLTAYVADPEKGQGVLNSLAGKSLTAASALLSGLSVQAAEVAGGFGAGEMRFGEQLQRFGAAQPIAERGAFLSQIERAEKEFGEQQAVEITFGGLEQSIRAADKLASRERARFAGSSGTGTTSFTRPTAGQF